MPDASLSRRWYRFRLRTLVIAVAVLAVPCAWVGSALQWMRQRQIALVGGAAIQGAPSAHDEVRELPFALYAFGEKNYLAIARPKNSPLTLEQLKQLFPGATVWDVDMVVLPSPHHEAPKSGLKNAGAAPPLY